MKFKFTCIRLQYSIFKSRTHPGYHLYSLFDMRPRFHSYKIVETLFASPFIYNHGKWFSDIIFVSSEHVFGLLLNLVSRRTKGFSQFDYAGFSVLIPKSSHYVYMG
jgi:hypothetical protein